MDPATRGRLGGTEASLRDKGFEIATRNISQWHSLDNWKARYLKEYDPDCKEPELTQKAEMLYRQQQRRNALGRGKRK